MLKVVSKSSAIEIYQRKKTRTLHVPRNIIFYKWYLAENVRKRKIELKNIIKEREGEKGITRRTELR